MKRFLLLVIIFFYSPILTQKLNNNEYVILHMDQIGHSTYHLNYLSPGFFPDIRIGTVMIDGSLNMPNGIYNINLYNFESISDTNQIRNYFKWRQGDFQFKEISIGINSTIINDGQIKLLSLGRSFPGPNGLLGPDQFNYKGNTLQNYMIDYYKENKLGTINVGMLYHKENTGLPLNNLYNKRESESFHSGINFTTSISNIDINSFYSFQLGKDVRNEKLLEHLINWYDIYGNYQINSNNNISLKLWKKKVNVESSDYNFLNTNKINQMVELEYGYNNKKQGFIFGLDYFNSKVTPVFEIYKNILAFNISASISNSAEIIISDSLNILNEYQKTSILSIIWNNNNLFLLNTKLSAMLIEWDNYKVPGLKGNINYVNSWLSTNGGIAFYESTQILIDIYAYLSTKIQSKLWWSDRYEVFLGLDGFYYNFPGNTNIDFESITGISNISFNSNNISFYNFKIGLEVRNFTFTYFMKFNSSEELNMSPLVNSIDPFSFLEVNWKFIN